MSSRSTAPDEVGHAGSAALARSSSARRDPRAARLSWQRALLLAVGWPAAVAVILAVEPPASEPTGGAALIANSILLVFFAAFVVTVVSAARRRASATAWSTFAAGASIALTITCPLSGHHHKIGLWWVAQLAVCASMMAASRVARRGA